MDGVETVGVKVNGIESEGGESEGNILVFILLTSSPSITNHLLSICDTGSDETRVYETGDDETRVCDTWGM